MKAKVLMIVAIILSLLIALTVFFVLVKFTHFNNGDVSYSSNNETITLERKDAETVQRKLSNLFMHSASIEVPACGVSEDCLVIGDCHVYFALDGCNTMYIEEKDAYVYPSKEDYKAIRDLVKNYT